MFIVAIAGVKVDYDFEVDGIIQRALRRHGDHREYCFRSIFSVPLRGLCVKKSLLTIFKVNCNYSASLGQRV